MVTPFNDGSDAPAQDGSGPGTPVGVWAGTAVHDGQTETFTISFAPDGGLTLVTPISTGRGTWEPTEDGFTYAFRETLAPEAGRPGYVDVVVRARRSGGIYTGSGPAEVRTPDGTVVHRTTFETSADLRAEASLDLLANGSPLASAPQAVREAAELAGAQAEKADSERRVQPEVIQALTDAGFARWFVPRAHGGEPGTFADLTRSVAALGEQCSATAWLASLFAFAPRYVACLPEQAQSDVWAAGPDTRVVVVNKPLGTAERTEDGWRLTGEWTFVSGVEYADWALLAGPAMAGPGGPGGPGAAGPGAGGPGAGGPGAGARAAPVRAWPGVRVWEAPVDRVLSGPAPVARVLVAPAAARAGPGSSSCRGPTSRTATPGTPWGCAAPAATPSSSTTCSSPSTGPASARTPCRAGPSAFPARRCRPSPSTD